jgi:hypothetical protein
MTHSHRIELAERFLAEYCQRTGVFKVHWGSPWRGSERVVYLSTNLEDGLLGVVDIFIETSREMGVQMNWTFGVTTTGYSKLWFTWMPSDLHPVDHALECILKADIDHQVEILTEEDYGKALEEAVVHTDQDILPWLHYHANRELLLAELGDSSVATLERRVAFTAGDGGLDAALHSFDKQLWPLVSADGERLIVERWRRLRTLLIPEPDEGETPTATIHS